MAGKQTRRSKQDSRENQKRESIRKAARIMINWEKQKQQSLRKAALCMINDELIPVIARTKALGIDYGDFVDVCNGVISDLWDTLNVELTPSESRSVRRDLEVYKAAH